ncbi:hypothetical protein [Sphingobium sp. Sx8-8]|uniref:hypothetical protein n=1 Tax=Sphingobium sp. Sx8-8 TaxID=2933617 RepID=UPI001F57C8A1|nr:hypothetical protein [Sphingobium sp. Sx8-8]
MRKISWFALAAPALLMACARPIHDQSTLHEVRIEAQTLIKNAATKAQITVPKSKWPQTIASLNPKSITVLADGVDILIIPSFDGGSGYFIPLKEREIPEPKGRFATVSQGVYWYHPY